MKLYPANGGMDMFGGLTKTSSRIAIAAALGLVVGGFAFKATPARAADLGGDCCADLEERVAELEATTVRKGNKKVSVTLSGWVIKSFNWWDDGDISSAYVGDKGYDLGSRFAITGSATIAPGWSAGYNLTVNVWGTKFATSGTSLGLPADWCFQSVRRRRLWTDGAGQLVHWLDQHALLVHLHQERQVGHSELGSFEPGV